MRHRLELCPGKFKLGSLNVDLWGKNNLRDAPVVVSINGTDQDVPESASIAELLDQLGLKAQHVAVEVNLQLVPRQHHAEYQLSAGDRLEIVTLVGGG